MGLRRSVINKSFFLSFTLASILCYLLTSSLPGIYKLNVYKGSKRTTSTVGAADFQAYWAASKLFTKKLNPYDWEAIKEEQTKSGFSRDGKFPFMNPPWSLPLVSPLALTKFSQGIIIWQIFSFSLLTLSGLLIWNAESVSSNKSYLIPWICLIFYPTFETILWGQFGAITTCSIASFYWAVKKNNMALAGVALFFLSMKPHPFILFFIVAAFWTISERKWLCILSSVLCLILSTALVEFIVPGVSLEWLNSIQRSAELKQTVMPCSLIIFIHLIQLIYKIMSDVVFKLALLAVPLSGLVFIIARIWKNKLKVDWDELPLILAAGFLTAPNIFVHDFCPLILLPMLSLTKVVNTKHLKPFLLAALLFQVVSLSFAHYSDFPPTSSFFWYPFLSLFLWLPFKGFNKQVRVKN